MSEPGAAADAEFGRDEAAIRTQLAGQVRDALWAEFKRQSDAGKCGHSYVNEDIGLIDGGVDMDAAAAAVVDVFVAFMCRDIATTVDDFVRAFISKPAPSATQCDSTSAEGDRCALGSGHSGVHEAHNAAGLACVAWGSPA